MFALCSLAEGLPRALIEAMERGLPCIAHDYPVARYALGVHGILGDLTRPGTLAALLADDRLAADDDRANVRHRFVYERFSWDALRDEYVDMLSGAVGRRAFADAGQPG